MSKDKTVKNDFNLPNLDYIQNLYCIYKKHPDELNVSWKHYFNAMEKLEIPKLEEHKSKPINQAPQPAVVPEPSKNIADKQKSSFENEKIDHNKGNIRELIDAYRLHGHFIANINPLNTKPKSPEELPELTIKQYGFSENDGNIEFSSYGTLKEARASLKTILQNLQMTYCNNIGIEYSHLTDNNIKLWLQKRLEIDNDIATIEDKQKIFQMLNKADLFEKFLHTKYAGQKRFSLEGAETLLPILSTIINYGADLNGEYFVLGMAHRGRLNVIANILNKSYSEIFNQFEDCYNDTSFQYSGDVKYHKGFSGEIFAGKKKKKITISLCDNPSHLEAINTVVLGKVKALQKKYFDSKQSKIIPILIHGDAALSGQGIIYESLQLQKINGYDTGGTIHVVINNQIGFTTTPKNARSTYYCTDIAKTFGSPIFHVNAECPEECVYVAKLAVELRQEFGCDIFIDLNGYRRWGHSESDDPAFTQPIEYNNIKNKKSIRELYYNKLIHQGTVEKYMADELEKDFKTTLQRSLQVSKNYQGDSQDCDESSQLPNETALECKLKMLAPVQTAVSLDTLKKLGKKFCTIPSSFNIHPRLKAMLDKRLIVLNSNLPSIDWAFAEHLAFATLLSENKSIRMTGEDCQRGTFSQRHATWHDQKNGNTYIPLQYIQQDQGSFEILNSPLSEYGVLGFEYGYTLGNPDILNIWEAQFGDFANGAQIIIDQFVASGEQKWKVSSNLTMLLPHGYEGQGPEHSSARLERYLEICGNYNMQVTYPSTPAQYFHLIRRQAIKNDQVKPLIIMTPKSMLRNPHCSSKLDEFSEGRFNEILDDKITFKNAKKLILCSGKIYYDLIGERETHKHNDTAIIRIEQLYPLAKELLKTIIEQYEKCDEFCWVQEEPRNMGAWNYINAQINQILPDNYKIKYIGRRRSSSPATGFFSLHKKEQNDIIKKAFQGGGVKESLTIPKTIRG